MPSSTMSALHKGLLLALFALILLPANVEARRGRKASVSSDAGSALEALTRQTKGQPLRASSADADNEPVLGPGETNPLSTKRDRIPYLFRSIRVSANAEFAKFVGPRHELGELLKGGAFPG